MFPTPLSEKFGFIMIMIAILLNLVYLKSKVKITEEITEKKEKQRKSKSGKQIELPKWGQLIIFSSFYTFTLERASKSSGKCAQHGLNAKCATPFTPSHPTPPQQKWGYEKNIKPNIFSILFTAIRSFSTDFIIAFFGGTGD